MAKKVNLEDLYASIFTSEDFDYPYEDDGLDPYTGEELEEGAKKVSRFDDSWRRDSYENLESLFGKKYSLFIPLSHGFYIENENEIDFEFSYRLCHDHLLKTVKISKYRWGKSKKWYVEGAQTKFETFSEAFAASCDSLKRGATKEDWWDELAVLAELTINA